MRRASEEVFGLFELRAFERIDIHALQRTFMLRTCRARGDCGRRGWSEFVNAASYSDPSRSASFGACIPCEMGFHDDPHFAGDTGSVPYLVAAMVGRPGVEESRTHTI